MQTKSGILQIGMREGGRELTSFQKPQVSTRQKRIRPGIEEIIEWVDVGRLEILPDATMESFPEPKLWRHSR